MLNFNLLQKSLLISAGITLVLLSCQTEHPIMQDLAKNSVSPPLSKNVLPSSKAAYKWALPEGFPEPKVPKNNPITAEKVELGRFLFYDKNLSKDKSMSCASCHEQDKAFTDGLATSQGVTKEHTARNSMSLTNVAYSSVLTWGNPHMQVLETQLLIPIFGEDPPELGMAGAEDELLSRFKADKDYVQRFKKAFPEEAETITLNHLAQAIASFERTLISAESPYDKFVFGGDKKAISEAAKRGERLFFSERLECFHCHGGFNFSDSSTHSRSSFLEFNFHNTGLYNTDGKGAYPPKNNGVKELTNKPEDMGRFKAPTLRNIALTAPYMHDGSVKTLKEVIAHYAAGGRTLTEGPHQGVGSKNPYKNGFVNGFKLSGTEEADLIAFLNSLTDQKFIENPAFSDPFAK